MKKIIGIFILTLLGFSAQSQIVGTYKKFEVGAGLGLSQYTGDVSYRPNLLNTRFGGEGYLRYNFNPIWAMRFNVGSYFLSGWDKNSSTAFQKERNYAFNAIGADMALLFEYNFFNFRGKKKYPNFSPYFFAGVGFAGFNVYTNIEKQRAGRAYPFRVSTPTIPFGLGVKFPLGPRFNWAIEFRTTKTFTEDLDMLDGDYTRYNDIRLVGHNDKKDMYYYLGASISYRFVSLKCPADYPEPYFPD